MVHHAADHSAKKILGQRLVCHSLSRLLHSCHTLSRWPWSAPLHQNNTSLGPQPPPRFESSRLLDLNHLTLRFSSPRGCARFTVRIRRLRIPLHWLPQKLIPIRFISFHILSFVNPFVPMSATFDSSPASSCPWLVATTAISLQCDDGSQQSHSGVQVFSLPLQLRAKIVNNW